MRKYTGALNLMVLLLAGLGLFLLISSTAAEPPAQTAGAAASPIAVEVVRPERENVGRSITLPGSFFPFEETTLYAKVSGYLKSISVDIGDRVGKGQMLAVLDAPELSAEYQNASADRIRAEADLRKAEAELLRCEADLELKQLTLDRLTETQKREPEAIARQEVDAARLECKMAIAAAQIAESEIEVAKAKIEAAQATVARLAELVEYTRITAPFAGVVTRRYVHPGALIPEGTAGSQSQPVVAVARTDLLRFRAQIPEPEVPFLSAGQTRVGIHVDSLPGRTFEARLSRISESLDPSTRTMLVEVDIRNSEGILKPGMYGNAEFILQSNPNALVIPAGAVLIESGRPHVLQVVDQRVKLVPIRTGSDDGIRVEVLEGLRQTDLVVVGGKNLVNEGDTVVPRLKGGAHERS